jgi:transposase
MSATPEQLPTDIEAMQQLFIAQAAELKAAKAGLVAYALEIEKLKFQLTRLRRQKFGSSSERIAREIGQLQLRLEELETTKAEAEAKAEAAAPVAAPAAATAAEAAAAAVKAAVAAANPAPTAEGTAPQEPAKPKKPRRKFPEHLPRTTIVHEPTQGCPTPGCDGTLRKVGEDVTEVLRYIPGHFAVDRHVRPAMSCRKCEGMVQAPMPALPIPRGEADASVLAHVAIAKYCDHLPLYRQSEIYARDDVDLHRSLLADWMGKIAWLLALLAQKIAEHVMAGSVIHADDTPSTCWPPAVARPRPAASGCICAMSALTSGRRRRQSCSTTARTARASAAGRIWPRSPATFMPTGIPGITSFSTGTRMPNLVRSSKLAAGAIIWSTVL